MTGNLGYPEFGYMESLRPEMPPVIDRVAPPRRVRQRAVANFQAAWRPRPRTYDVGRRWTKKQKQVAAIIFPVSVLGIIIVVWSVMAARAMGAG